MAKLRTRQKKNDPIFPTDYGEKKPGLLRVYPQRSERRRARCPQLETTKMLRSLSWQRTPVSTKFWSSESNNLSARHYSDLTMSSDWLWQRINYMRWHFNIIFDDVVKLLLERPNLGLIPRMMDFFSFLPPCCTGSDSRFPLRVLIEIFISSI